MELSRELTSSSSTTFSEVSCEESLSPYCSGDSEVNNEEYQDDLGGIVTPTSYQHSYFDEEAIIKKLIECDKTKPKYKHSASSSTISGWKDSEAEDIRAKTPPTSAASKSRTSTRSVTFTRGLTEVKEKAFVFKHHNDTSLYIEDYKVTFNKRGNGGVLGQDIPDPYLTKLRNMRKECILISSRAFQREIKLGDIQSQNFKENKKGNENGYNSIDFEGQSKQFNGHPSYMDLSTPRVNTVVTPRLPQPLPLRRAQTEHGASAISNFLKEMAESESLFKVGAIQGDGACISTLVKAISDPLVYKNCLLKLKKVEVSSVNNIKPTTKQSRPEKLQIRHRGSVPLVSRDNSSAQTKSLEMTQRLARGGHIEETVLSKLDIQGSRVKSENIQDLYTKQNGRKFYLDRTRVLEKR